MIVDLLLSSLIPLFLMGVIFYGSKSVMDDSFFMSKSDGNFLKGLCAVIVVLFHFPQSYQNPLQTKFYLYHFINIQYSINFYAYIVIKIISHIGNGTI